MISEFFTIEETLLPFSICREDGVAVLGAGGEADQSGEQGYNK